LSKYSHIKVCIVTISLAKGGAERSTAILSQMLDSQGFNVHMVILTNAIDYPYAGKLYNLGELKDKQNNTLSRFKRFQQLRKYLKLEQFDLIIDNRNRMSGIKELYYLNYIYRKQHIVYVVRSFNLDQYFPKQKAVSKLMVKRAVKIVGVAKAVSEAVNKQFSTDKATTIYNPTPVFKTQATPSPFKVKYVIFLGRLVENVKNFSLLLEGYKKSGISAVNVHLKIMGEGPDIDFIQNKVEELDLSDTVEIVPFTPNIQPYIANAEFLALTSHYEGFPRVLIEALSQQTPVVSVDCKSGPNEIIKQGENGLLVPNYNAEALGEAFAKMINEPEFLLHCKSNALSSIAHLKTEQIAPQWSQLILNAITH
jgi:glycosyltransferase involved in cell wall biosynthesis